MSKYHRFITSGVSALFTALAFCAAPGNRVFYGFSLGSAEFADDAKEYDHGFVAYPFDPNENDAEISGRMLDSYYSTPEISVYAGTGVEGLIYACEYSQPGKMSPQPGNMVVYNTFNGTREVVGEWNPDQTDFILQDMTWNEKEGRMYAVGYYRNQPRLYAVNPETAKFTFLCNLSHGGSTIAAAPDGTLYSLSSSGVLYTINPSNGKATLVFDTGLGELHGRQSMEFDRASGLLYWISMTDRHPQGEEESWLQELDPIRRTIREVGRVGMRSRFVGFHIPSAQNLLAPAAPSEFAVSTELNDGLSNRLTWKVPTTTLNGISDTGTLYSYVISRNGVQIKMGSSVENPITPGAEMEWTDTTIQDTGNYRYDLFFVNGKGNGARGTVYKYIGSDAPGKVTGIKGEPLNDMRSLHLSWEAPTSGRHLGDYDPDAVRYTVTRSDNRVIAKDIKDCETTDDEYDYLDRYSYTVTAANEHGHTDTFSRSFIIGPALDLPLDQTFGSAEEAENLWTQTNDWVISPPLRFEAGKKYEITVSFQTAKTAQLDFYLGNSNNATAMTKKFNTLVIVPSHQNPSVEQDETPRDFYQRSVMTPYFQEEAVCCLGLRLTIPPSDEEYLQLDGISMKEIMEHNGILDTGEENGSFSIHGHLLTIAGDFRNAEIFDMNGRKVATATSPTIDLNNFISGVYVLNIDGRSFKITL